MAELTQVLGTILKDVAQSRVISDTFSRDISVDYANDPILINFPVPRVEIKQASIALKFAVNAVEQKLPDTDSIVHGYIARYAPVLAQQVFERTVLENPNKEQLLAMLEEKQTDLQGQLAEKTEGLLVESAKTLLSQPEAVSKQLQGMIQQVLREDSALWNALRKGILVRDLNQIIEKLTTAAVSALKQQIEQAVGSAGRQGVSVDVAVSRGELLDLPEAILSHVNIVAEIRNYEWTTVGGTDEQPIRRLQPE